MQDNLLTFAVSQGVDLSDPDELSDFMDVYNAMSQEEREAITDTGALPPGSSFGPGGAVAGGAPTGAAFGLTVRPDLHLVGDNDRLVGDEVDDEWLDDKELGDFWPPFLGPPPEWDIDTPLVGADAEIADFYDRTLLVVRADAFMDWLGEGRPLTRSGALKRTDTAGVVERLDLPAASRSPRSMWDVPELVRMWLALQDGEFIDADSGEIRPGDGRIPWSVPEPTVEHRIARGVLLHLWTLVRFLDDLDDEASGPTAPYTVTALLKAAEPDGFTVPESAPDAEDRMLQVSVAAGVAGLVPSGIVERHGDTFYFPKPLLFPLSMATEIITGEFQDGVGLEDGDGP